MRTVAVKFLWIQRILYSKKEHDQWKIPGTLKLTASSHLKMDGWNTFSFPFGARPIFRGKMAVSFREGNNKTTAFDQEESAATRRSVEESRAASEKALMEVHHLLSKKSVSV